MGSGPTHTLALAAEPEQLAASRAAVRFEPASLATFDRAATGDLVPRADNPPLPPPAEGEPPAPLPTEPQLIVPVLPPPRAPLPFETGAPAGATTLQACHRPLHELFSHFLL